MRARVEVVFVTLAMVASAWANSPVLTDETSAAFADSSGETSRLKRDEHAQPEIPRPPGDLNADGCVDVLDLFELAAAWNTPLADMNGDAITDFYEFTLLTSSWGHGCHPADASAD